MIKQNTIKKRLILASVVLTLTTLTSFSQNGPGGVGSTETNGLWLKADSFSNDTFGQAGSWPDSSGNNNAAVQLSTASKQPISIATSDINGMPIVRFDGIDDEMQVADTDILDDTEGLSYFVVLRPSNLDNNPRGILGKRVDLSTLNDYSYTWFFWKKRYINLDLETQNNRFTASPISFLNETNYILSFVFDGRLNKTERSKMYNEMDLIKTNGETSSKINNSNQPLTIGALNQNYGFYLGADYAEIIQYNYSVNEAERIIINNYLSAKYNITVSSNDFYQHDSTVNGNFDFNVAGIGRASDGSSHTDSKGSGIIRINTPSELGDNEFLFWGENTRNASYTFSSSESTNYLERLDTQWRVSKHNNLGSVNVSINASDIKLNSSNGCNDLKLIVSSSSNFTTKTEYNLELDGDVYTATSVNFNDNDYFTIEYRDLVVLDNTGFYNGSGIDNAPNINDSCYKLLVKSTADGTLPLSEDANVREVEVETGGKLVVNSGFRLQVTEGLEINGELRLTGDSQLIQTHRGPSLNKGTGSLFIDQNSEHEDIYSYNYWSSPVSSPNSINSYTLREVLKDGTAPTTATSIPRDINFIYGNDGNFNESSISIAKRWIFSFLENESSTSNFKHQGDTGVFNAGEGYLLKGPGRPQNYTFKGIPNDGDISFTISENNLSLLGNPYPSAVDANQLFADSNNIEALYFWEHQDNLNGHNQAGYVGGYGIRCASMSIAGTKPVIAGNGISAGVGDDTSLYTSPGRYIPVGQSFFVAAVQGNSTVNFRNTQRVYIPEDGVNSVFLKSTQSERIREKSINNLPILKIGFEYKDENDIYLHSQVGISFKEGNNYANEIGYDVRQFDIGYSNLYFHFLAGDENKLAIAGLGMDEITSPAPAPGTSLAPPTPPALRGIPIALDIQSEGPVYIMIDEKRDIEKDIYIYDRETGNSYNLDEPIELLGLKGHASNGRFNLVFLERGIFSKKKSKHTSKQIDYLYNSVNNKIIVTSKNDGFIESAKLYNLLGKEIMFSSEIVNKGKKVIINTSKIPTSIYMLSLKTDKGFVSKKIIIE